ncbi:PAS domain-containing protein [Denitrobaculum tricleocarpae]|nr:PAS domain-containing protein [Denitrobaculum tricleocarpae]
MHDTICSARPDAINDPVLSALYRYWARLRKSDGPPLRSDLDPVEIPQLLPYVLLVECHDEGRRIKFRLVGTDVAFGSDPTGRFLQDAVPKGPYGAHIVELYRFAANGEAALYSEFRYGYTRETGPRLIKRLFLPLIGTAEIPRMMLVGQIRDKSIQVEQSAWQAGPGQIDVLKLCQIAGEAANWYETSDCDVQEASNNVFRPQPVSHRKRA